jgi:hypothetical protein
MRCSSHEPAPPLGKLIHNFWHCADAPAHARERILPSGTIELVINLREDEIRIHDSEQLAGYRRFPGIVVSGAAGPIIDTQVIYRLEPDGDARESSSSTPARAYRSPVANRLSEESSLVGRKCSSGFPAWSGALRGVKAAKSETSVQKFKSRQQWLSQPLAGFAVTNQSREQDGD